MGQTRSIIIGLALVLGQTAAAYAADLGLPLPEPEPCVGCAGPWYLKGFVGMPPILDVGGIDYELITPDFVTYDKDIKSTPLFGLGFGYDTGHYFRFDLTGEYRGDAPVRLPRQISRRGRLIRLRSGAGTNEYTADIESWVGLANAYIDLGTWWCITPYVGGGVGFASLSIIGYKDVNVPNLSVAYGQNNTETNFAWARLCRPVLQGEPVAHPRSLLSLYRSRRHQDGQDRHLRQSADLGRLRRSRTSPPTISCFPCAWLWAASQRRCRSPLNKSPSTIDC